MKSIKGLKESIIIEATLEGLSCILDSSYRLLAPVVFVIAGIVIIFSMIFSMGLCYIGM